jgi:hypothetical protein
MAELTHNEDHVAQGLALLLETFKGKPRLAAVLTSYLVQIQELEDQLWVLFTERWIDSAYGLQLDGLGEIVGEKRQGSDDDEYRAFVRARVKVNRSNGKIKELVEILSLIQDGGAAQAREYYPAGIRLEAVDVLSVNARRVNRMLQQAKGAGINLAFVYSKDEGDSTLTFGSTYGGDGVTADQSPGSEYTTDTGGGSIAGEFA